MVTEEQDQRLGMNAPLGPNNGLKDSFHHNQKYEKGYVYEENLITQLTQINEPHKQPYKLTTEQISNLN